MTFELAVCSEMVFTDLPIIERVRRIHDLGFAVEIWSWHDKDLDALAATGATFSSMTGYLHGDLIDPDRADEVVRTAELTIKAAETLGVPRLNLHTAELVDGKAARPPPPRDTGRDVAGRAAGAGPMGELGARRGVTFCVENLNTIVDHPGCRWPGRRTPLALVEAVGHPNVKMMLDLYHAQIGEGNLDRTASAGAGTRSARSRSPTCRAAASRAPVRSTTPPSRRRSPNAGFTGTVGMEAWAPATASRLSKRSAPRSPSDNPVGQ